MTQERSSYDTGLVAGCVLLLLCLCLLSDAALPFLKRALVRLAEYEAGVSAFLHTHAGETRLREGLPRDLPGLPGTPEALSRDPVSLETLPWDTLHTCLAVLGRPFAVCTLVVQGILIVLSFRLSPRDRFRRVLSMQGLLHNNLAGTACIAPVLTWGRSLLEEPPDRGPWRLALQPVRFAVQQGLLRRADTGARVVTLPVSGNAVSGRPALVLDRGQAWSSFRAQLGEPYAGFFRLPGYLQALALAFILFAQDRKDEARALLDQLSRSFRPVRKRRSGRLSGRLPFLHSTGTDISWTICADLPLSGDAIRALLATPLIADAIRIHDAFRNLTILSLYSMARKKGVLTTAEFIWLRPVNRRLFYLLNNHGRKTCWVEVAGAWTHYQAEELSARACATFRASDLSHGISVDAAVDGLEQALREEGWLLTEETAASASPETAADLRKTTDD